MTTATDETEWGWRPWQGRQPQQGGRGVGGLDLCATGTVDRTTALRGQLPWRLERRPRRRGQRTQQRRCLGELAFAVEMRRGAALGARVRERCCQLGALLLLLSFSSSSGGAARVGAPAALAWLRARAGAATLALPRAWACVCAVCVGQLGREVKSPFAECPRSGTRQSFFLIFLILCRVPPGLALGKEFFF